MTATRDGRWLIEAEGATITFFDMWDVTLGYNDTALDLHDGSKRVDAGELGFLASRMVLDPGADDEPGPVVIGGADPHYNLLYIAACRDGLWMMEADVDPSVTNKAWRIDDSGNLDPATQSSRRWCTDVGTMKVGAKTYLLALFTKKSQSRLRVYDLDTLRAIADPLQGNSEIGNEVAPVSQVILGNNPNAPTPSPPTFGRSVALAMAVDQEGTGQSDYRSDVYVAMGHHGLVQVAFDEVAGQLTHTKTWGPVFGDGSAIWNGLSPPPPSGKTPGLYGDLDIVLPRPHVQEARIERSELPLFTDVAVFDGTIPDHNNNDNPVPFHQLYVAVDHLFWLVYDLDDPAGFSSTMRSSPIRSGTSTTRI